MILRKVQGRQSIVIFNSLVCVVLTLFDFLITFTDDHVSWKLNGPGLS